MKLTMSKNKIPVHLVLIPDGNRRWALSKGLAKIDGYKTVDYEHLESLLLEAKKLGVKYVSLWIFSTDNWKRPKSEINFLFNHFLNNLDALLTGANKYKVRVRHIGRKDRLPLLLRKKLEELEKKTEKYDEFNVQLCLDYGGRDEIIRAVNKLIKSKKKNISEAGFNDFLDTKGLPDVDFIIRTSGEHRTSGLMPFQSAYAELYFADCHFPDFDGKELKKAIIEYTRRQRRFGGS